MSTCYLGSFKDFSRWSSCTRTHAFDLELRHFALLPTILPTRYYIILHDCPWIPALVNLLIWQWCPKTASRTGLSVTHASEQPELARMVVRAYRRLSVAIKWCLGAFKKMTHPVDVFASVEILSYTSCMHVQTEHKALDPDTAGTKR